MVILQVCISSFLLALSVASFSGKLSDFEQLQEKQTQWIKQSVDILLTSAPKMSDVKPFPELGLVQGKTLEKIGKTLYCSIEVPLSHSQHCSEYTVIQKGRLIYLVDDEEKAVFLGYGFFLNRPKLPPNSLRKMIYERAQELWPLISDLLNHQHTDYQQFHVGYGSGGAIATLMAYRGVLSSPLKNSKIEKRNPVNQVKVLTVDEISIFTTEMTLDAIGALNHAAFFSRRFKETEGFHTNAEKFIGEEYVIDCEEHPQIPEEKLSLFLRPQRPENLLDQSQIKDYQQLLQRNLGTAKLFVKNFHSIFTKISQKMYGNDQEMCATKLQDRLNSFLPHHSDYTITCKLRQLQIRATFKADFEIQCSLVGSLSKISHIPISSYIAKFARFSNYEQACDSIKVTVPDSALNQCLKKLSIQSNELSMIWPVDEEHDKKKCHNFSINWNNPGSICVVKPSVSDQLLPRLQVEHPGLFLSFLDLQTVFPDECRNIISPLYLESSNLENAKTLISIASEYFRQMANPLSATKFSDTRKTLPPLFRQHDTGTFATKSLQISSDHFVAYKETSKELIDCIKSPTLRVINCTLPVNQWVSGTCPNFCAHRVPELKIHLCEMVVSCPKISAFFSITKTTIPQFTKSAFDSVKRVLDSTTVAQYALYKFSKAIYFSFTNIPLEIIDIFGEFNVGVFFYQLPACQSEKEGEEKKGDLCSADENDDENSGDDWIK